ncbi:hypothetical protein EZV62_004705 [Acer yangbiense]|uniref:HMA domain-containing protein n=1 Tax=Acer yangbiense TaxID=1000413 RepID=A0A5C7IKU5_9ROSI|nr:hypothetical protein EZV62_004705 [Acer yangbiense]
MGEEKKEVEKKEENKEEKKEEEKKEEKKEEEPPEIVLKVDMHCEACARKVARALKGFEVEDVSADSKASKVVVKGKAADPIKVCERLQKKSGRKVELISPLPKPPEEKKEEEIKEQPKEEEKKEEPPAVITVVLKVRMHCEACAQALQKRIRKIQDDDTKLEIKRSEYYWTSKYYSEYAYPTPQIFSDENPNACSVM